MQTLQIASTIGPVDAGIVPLLIKTFEKNTNIKVSCQKAGTGVILNQARTGCYDLVIVHAKELEDKFIEEGFGKDRRDIMYNDFVLLGSKNDPAKVKGMTSIKEAFEKIANSNSFMITRGDNSGTHVKEMEIWKACNIEPKGNWYETFEDGDKGNKPTILYANLKDAYVLIDRATWLIFKDELQLDILVQNDSLMMNFISSILVSSKKFASVNNENAIKFADFLVGAEAQEIIKNYEVEKYGEPLFFPNAKK